MQHMRNGNFAAAWEVSDEVLRSRRGHTAWHLPRHLQWVWDRTPLAGKRVLIRCYHGLGDTIQFIRYAPQVRQTATQVTVVAQPELLPLLQTVRGIDVLVPLSDDEPQVDCDVTVEVMELPHVFRSTRETLPADIPYLHVPPAELHRNKRLQVGLTWRCGDFAPERSIPGALLAPLAKVPGVTLHILQRGSGLAEWPPGQGIDAGADDLMEAARRIAALDLMITIDSMPAHLAGALGVRTWTMLRAEADWRWMERRENTPWYPTMRLFRQEEEGRWEPVVKRVVGELQRLAADRRQSMCEKS
ncbi:hypothetical protein BH20VER1_BH20VER1_24810 [soil metagenome]